MHVIYTLMRVDFDTLRDKLVYYNTNINLSYRQMPAARMRIESTLCAAL
jgi:hypothetical protein